MPSLGNASSELNCAVIAFDLHQSRRGTSFGTVPAQIAEDAEQKRLALWVRALDLDVDVTSRTEVARLRSDIEHWAAKDFRFACNQVRTEIADIFTEFKVDTHLAAEHLYATTKGRLADAGVLFAMPARETRELEKRASLIQSMFRSVAQSRDKKISHLLNGWSDARGCLFEQLLSICDIAKLNEWQFANNRSFMDDVYELFLRKAPRVEQFMVVPGDKRNSRSRASIAYRFGFQNAVEAAVKSLASSRRSLPPMATSPEELMSIVLNDFDSRLADVLYDVEARQATAPSVRTINQRLDDLELTEAIHPKLREAVLVYNSFAHQFEDEPKLAPTWAKDLDSYSSTFVHTVEHLVQSESDSLEREWKSVVAALPQLSTAPDFVR